MTAQAFLTASAASPAGRAVLAAHRETAAGPRIMGWILLVVIVAVAAAGAAALVSPRWRRIAPRAIGWLLGGLVATYAVGRGVAEFFVVNYTNPASYQKAWGGPSLAGVFAVHSGPGLIVLIVAAAWLWRRRRARTLAGAGGE